MSGFLFYHSRASHVSLQGMPLPLPQVLKSISNAAVGFFAARIVVMLSTLAVVYLNTAYLGIEGQGRSSLLIFGILLIVALSNFIGGGALVYLIPRMPTGATALPGIAWAIISALFFYPIFLFTHWLPEELVLHACLLGGIQSLYIYLAQITLAHRHAKAYNLGVALQSASVVTAMFVCYHVWEQANTRSLVLSMYFSFGLTLLWFLLSTAHYWKEMLASHRPQHLKEMLRLGKFTQGGNVLQLLNQRMNAAWLNELSGPIGLGLAGLYSIALYVAEAVWTVAKSLSFDQYSRISNTTDTSLQHRIVKEYLLIVRRVSVIAVAAIAVVPQSFYEWVFSKELPQLRLALLVLLPGITSNAASIIYAHFFSGTGRHRLNFIGSAIAFSVGISIALACIPRWGIVGAAASATLAFIAQWTYLYFNYQSIKHKEILHSAEA